MKRNSRKFWNLMFTLMLVMILVIGGTVSSYAASGTVTYRFEDVRKPIVALDIPTVVGVTINLGATFKYVSSDTQSRSYNNEEYFMSTESINSPTVTRELTFGMGILEVHPTTGSVKYCNRDYYPASIWPTNLLFHDNAGSNTSLAIKKTGNSYGKLGYSIGGNVVYTLSGTATFNNLGTAIGIISLTGPNIKSNKMEKSTEDNSADKINLNKANKMTEMVRKTLAPSEHKEAISNFQKKNAAMLSYAEQNNLLATDEEVAKYIENLLTDINVSKDKAFLEKVYGDAGTTYEKAIRDNFDMYKVLLTEEKVYEVFLESYLKEHSVKEIDKKMQDKIYAAWDNYF